MFRHRIACKKQPAVVKPSRQNTTLLLTVKSKIIEIEICYDDAGASSPLYNTHRTAEA